MKLFIPLYLWQLGIYHNTSEKRWGKDALPVGKTLYRIKLRWLGPLFLALHPNVQRLQRWGIKPPKERLELRRLSEPDINLLGE